MYYNEKERDEFAGKALMAIIQTDNAWRDADYVPVDGLSNIEQYARLAYMYADAMCKEKHRTR